MGQAEPKGINYPTSPRKKSGLRLDKPRNTKIHKTNNQYSPVPRRSRPDTSGGLAKGEPQCLPRVITAGE